MGETLLAQRPEAGVVIGGYELVRRIGRGGMAEVWVAHRSMGVKGSKYVAIKLLADHYVGDERYCRMFRAEVELAAVLSHANIVQVFDGGQEEGRSYFVMEWVDGLNLLKVRTVLAMLRDEGRRLRVIAYIIGQLLHALKYAHSITSVDGSPLGVVHRDVSPQNVLVSNQGEVKLTDFGVAYQASEESSGIHVKGKIRYMAPEQLIGQSHSPTVDLYAVGALLHEMLDGVRFRDGDGNAQDLIATVLAGATPPLSRSVPPELERLRLGLLQKDPKRRIQTATEALIMLKHYPGYGDARDELTELCQGLTGVVRPRTGPGQSSQVPMTDRATTPFSSSDLATPVGSSMMSAASTDPAPVIAPPPPFGSTSAGGDSAKSVTPVLLSGNAVFLDLRTNEPASEATPGADPVGAPAVVHDPEPSEGSMVGLRTEPHVAVGRTPEPKLGSESESESDEDEDEDEDSSTSVLSVNPSSTPTGPRKSTLRAPRKGSEAVPRPTGPSNPVLRRMSASSEVLPSPTSFPTSAPRSLPTSASRGPSMASPIPMPVPASAGLQISAAGGMQGGPVPMPGPGVGMAAARPWHPPVHAGWSQPRDPWAGHAGPGGHPHPVHMPEAASSATEHDIPAPRIPGDGTDTSMASLPVPVRSTVSSTTVAVAIALVVLVSTSLAAAWFTLGREHADPPVTMLDADAPVVDPPEAIAPVHPLDDARDDDSTSLAGLEFDEASPEQVHDEDEATSPAEFEVAESQVPPPPVQVEPKKAPRTRVRVQAQPGLSEAQLSIGSQVISVGKLRDRSATVEVGRRRMKWRAERGAHWESAGAIVLRRGRAVTLLITRTGVKTLSS